MSSLVSFSPLLYACVCACVVCVLCACFVCVVACIYIVYTYEYIVCLMCCVYMHRLVHVLCACTYAVCSYVVCMYICYVCMCCMHVHMLCVCMWRPRLMSLSTLFFEAMSLAGPEAYRFG